MSPTRIFPAIALLALAAQAHATEGGASIYPHGVEGFMAGALPPPSTFCGVTQIRRGAITLALMLKLGTLRLSPLWSLRRPA